MISCNFTYRSTFAIYITTNTSATLPVSSSYPTSCALQLAPQCKFPQRSVKQPKHIDRHTVSSLFKGQRLSSLPSQYQPRGVSALLVPKTYIHHWISVELTTLSSDYYLDSRKVESPMRIKSNIDYSVWFNLLPGSWSLCFSCLFWTS